MKGRWIEGIGFISENDLAEIGDVFLSLPSFTFQWQGKTIYVRGGRGQEENLVSQILMPITGTSDMNRWTDNDFSNALDIISNSNISDFQKGRWSNVVIKVGKRLKLGSFLKRAGGGLTSVWDKLTSLPAKIMFGAAGAIVLVFLGLGLMGKLSPISGGTPYGKIKFGGKK